MKRLLVLNVVGMTPSLLAHAPNLRRLAGEGFMASVRPVLPAVTCSVQATYLTGLLPRDHGIVGNGWFFRELGEVLFWRQSAALMSGEKLWEAARRIAPGATTAQLFWWYNLGTGTEWSVTPRPAYPADGRKIPDIHARPPELRTELTERLGPFPLFDFWGPRAGIRSSEWIADCAGHVLETRRPSLALVYLPHLDYPLQRLGPGHPSIPGEVAAVDRIAGRLIERARAGGSGIVVLSEYGIEAATGPVHINRVLREAGFLEVHRNVAGEQLDPFASRAFAVSDHQVAHVYVRNPADVGAVRDLVYRIEGIDRILDDAGKRAEGLDHSRSGDLVAVAAPGRWFTYYYWLDDRAAPDFARTVDIHRKPGYDPVELFLDPAKPWMTLRIAGKLARKAAGFRTLMDVIPLDAALVKGTHGRRAGTERDGPLLISDRREGGRDRFAAEEVRDFLLGRLGSDAAARV